VCGDEKELKGGSSKREGWGRKRRFRPERRRGGNSWDRENLPQRLDKTVGGP